MVKMASFFNLRTHPLMAATSPDSLQNIGGKNLNWPVKIQLRVISFWCQRQEVGRTCQYKLWFSAGNSTLGISQATWKRGGEKNSQFVFWRPSFMTHLCVCPPDFGGELNSCFDDKGSVRVHGHTRLPLDNKCTAIRQAHHHRSVPVSFVLKSNMWVCDFKPLHKVAEQVNDFLLQSRAVLNNWISFVRDLLLKLLQFLDLLSYLQLWLSQRGDPERQRLRRRNLKR